MKSRIFLFLAIALPFPVFAFAFEYAYIPDDALLILSSYTLASAVLIGVATSVLVAINSSKMKGGVFGKVLGYFSVGMFLVLLGFLAGEISFSMPENGVVIRAVHDALYIVGYIIMAVAAQKLLTAIKGDSGI